MPGKTNGRPADATRYISIDMYCGELTSDKGNSRISLRMMGSGAPLALHFRNHESTNGERPAALAVSAGE